MLCKRNFHQRNIVVLLIAVMLIALLSGCGGGGTEADGEEVIELSFSTHDPAQSPKTLYHEEWAKKINEVTDGRVEITVYPGGTLADPTDVLDAIRTGAADMGWVFTSFYPDQFPLLDIVSLPMLGIDSASQATNILVDLYEYSDALKEELSDYKMLMVHTNNPNFIATSKKPVHTLEDMKGLKLRATAGVATEMVTAWGATPMLMGPGDMYQSMEKGVIDGYIFEYSGIGSFKLPEITNHWTEVPIYVGPFMVLMNRDKWESLPEDIQEAIESVSGRETSLGAARTFEEDEVNVRKEIVEAGGNMIELDEEEYQKFKKAADEYNANWIKEHSTEDFDAEDYFNKTLELVEKYKEE